jgi:hypothetical protein
VGKGFNFNSNVEEERKRGHWALRASTAPTAKAIFIVTKQLRLSFVISALVHDMRRIGKSLPPPLPLPLPLPLAPRAPELLAPLLGCSAVDCFDDLPPLRVLLPLLRLLFSAR